MGRNSPGYLSDCIGKNPELCEIFIVDSGYAESAREMRDRVYQAVIRIDESIVKIEGTELGDLLDDAHVLAMIASLGTGIWFGSDGAYYDLGKLRYHKVILVTDDSDGGRHIREQVTTFMQLYNRPLVEAGYFFTVQPENWEEMFESEFEAKVMDPTTRKLIPIVATS